jgi:hypothetical protein
MNTAMWKKLLLVAVVLPIASLMIVGNPLSIGQDKAGQKKEAKSNKAKGRLPAYYADVVSQEQREKIYAIQAKYAEQIKALNDQLEALEKKQNDEIAGVLSAEQKEKVEAARAEAAAKKKKKSADKAKDGETKTEAKAK